MSLSRKEIYRRIAAREIDVDEGMKLISEMDNPRGTPVEKKKGKEGPGVEDAFRKALQDYLKGKVGELLDVAAADVSGTENFMEMGVDSTKLIELSRHLEEELNVELYPTLFFEYQNVEALVEYFCADSFVSLRSYFLKEESLKEPAPEETSGETPPVPAVGVETPVPGKRDDPEPVSVPGEPVAIIGMAGRFPGAANLTQFWAGLVQGENGVTLIPRERWDWEEYYGDPGAESDKTNVKWGGFITDIDKFDAGFFNISPREAELMDPQHRIFMECVWHTIEDAGYRGSQLSGKKIGIFVGAGVYSYAELLQEKHVPVAAYTSTGNAFSMLANRVSYFFNFTGPSEPVDTACSSALVAVHRAIGAIRAGDCEQAIVGGVNALLNPKLYISFNKAGMLSPDGRCKAFDEKANGYVRGEGVGAVLLKPLSMAQRDNDHIYAVIRGSAENHGGRANSLTAPNPGAQAEVIMQALRAADLDAGTITMLEAHGTGTGLGDPVEINGLKKAFESMGAAGAGRGRKAATCALGSIKTNIGHLETAAGIAGLLKVVLAMRNRQIPAHINFTKLNPYIKLEDTPFYIPEKTVPWSRLSGPENKPLPRRAGISSFGFGGVNAHLVLEEYESPPRKKGDSRAFLIPFSAKTEDSLHAYCRVFREWLLEPGVDCDLAEIENTLLTGREIFTRRLAVLPRNNAELLEGLDAFLAGEAREGLLFREKEGQREKPEFSQDTPDLFRECWREKKDLARAAELWVAGLCMDWSALSVGSGITRAALPGYQFEKRKFWIPDSPGEKEAESFKTGALHPLLDANASTLKEQKYVKEFSGKETYLKDHIVAGHKVLPGVVHLECGKAAGELASERKISLVTDLRWLRPLHVDEEKVRLVIGLYPTRQGIRFRLYKDGEEKTVYSEGALEFGIPREDTPARVDVEGEMRRAEAVLDAEECYEFLAAGGLVYGDSFRGIRKLYYSSESVLAELSPGASVYDGFSVHPGLLDGALQSIIGFTSREGEGGGRYLPAAVRRIEYFSAPRGDCYAYILPAGVRSRENTGTGKTFHISLLDSRGNVLLRFTDFEVKLYAGEGEVSNSGQRQSVLYAASRWAVTPGAEKPQGKEEILLFSRSNLFAGMVQVKEGRGVVLVKPGKSFREIRDGEYEIDYNSEEHCKELLSSLEAGGREIGFIVYDIAAEDFQPARERVEKQLNESIYALLPLVKSLLRSGGKKPLSILYVYPAAGLQPVYLSLAAWGRTVVAESTRLRFKLIGLDKQATSSRGKLVYGELYCPEKFEEIRYLGGERHRREFFETEPGGKDGSGILRRGGVYLITGGTGGLGLMFARMLAQRVEGVLILSGRSQPDERKLESVREACQGKSEVVYLEGDVTDASSLKEMAREITRNYGGLHGIIHAAGIIRDNYLAKKTAAEYKLVLGPKIQGVLNLDQAFRSEALDFFVLFSSVAVLGNPGQSDYAFANSFMDNFAEYRNTLVAEEKRSGKTISVNWPLWKEGGMRVDKQTEDYLFSARGLVPLTTSAGMKAFFVSLGASCPHLFVLEGEAAKIRSAFHLEKTTTGQKGISTFRIADFSSAFSADLTELMAEILKTGTGDLNADTDISGYGFDSVAYSELAAGLNKKFELDVTPAVFYEYTTISSLASYICESYTEKVGTYYAHTGKDEAAEPASAADSRLFSAVTKYLCGAVMKVSKVNSAEIDLQTDISEYGFDSISFTELCNTINSRYALDLTPPHLYEYSSVNALAQFLLEEYPAKLLRVHSSPEDAADTPAPQVLVAAPVMDRQRFSESAGRFSGEGIIFQDSAYEPVAIIGMAGIMPGSRNLEEFWDNLEKGKDCISEVPRERWDWKEYWGDPINEKNKTNIKWGGFIDDIDKFDAQFFDISPREAQLMDPQHRLFLEAVWHTIEDAGYRASDLAGSLTGIFVGVGTADYNVLLDVNDVIIEAYNTTGNADSVLANRVSYLLDLRGPSEPVDTACSSALIAVHRAVQAIRTGDCTQAIVGGVNALLSPKIIIAFNKAGMLALDGRCRTFDTGASGYVRGEGVGAVMLKPLSAARRDGDHIYAVILGSAENHGGRSKSLTAPNPVAQAEVIMKAMERAGVDPASISYLEAHGTGTNLGDPIEINGIKRAYKEMYGLWDKKNDNTKHCGIGSVKTNIGHLETAAGIAGLFKILLAMRHRTLPATIHFQSLNPYIKLDDSPFFVVRETIPWERLQDESGRVIPLRAGVSSFGFGGANSHVVLEEYNEDPVRWDEDEHEQVLILSAKTKEALEAYAAKMRDWFAAHHEQARLQDIAYTLQYGREEFNERLAIVAGSYAEAGEAMHAFINNQPAENVHSGSVYKRRRKVDRILEGEEGKAFIRNLITRRNLQKVAQLWVDGHSIDWGALDRGSQRRRLSLPVYPFTRKRFWFRKDESPGQVVAETADEPEEKGLYYFVPEWREADLPAESGVSSGNWLLFCPEDFLTSSPAEFFAPFGDVNLIKVVGGDSFRRREDNLYVIDPGNGADYEKLFQDLKQRACAPDWIINAFLLENSAEDPRALLDIRGKNWIYHCIKGIVKESVKSCRGIALLTFRDAESPRPEVDMLGAFSRSCPLILPDLSFMSLQFDSTLEIKDLGSFARKELENRENAGGEVYYNSKGKRNLKVLGEFPLRTAGTDILLKKEGVYLVTGGLGGIGFHVARYLLQEWDARLVLCGRSPLQGDKEERFKQLKEIRESVVYVRMDITSLAETAQAATGIKQEYGKLDGIIHAAGVVDSKLLMDKTLEEYNSIFLPKTRGTLVLDQVFEKEELDFFLLCSSTSSVLGDFGQGDYAMSNRFLDSFALYREHLRQRKQRHGITISIGWPLWRDGGMHLDEEAEKLYMQTTRLDYLESGAGIEIFKRSLQLKIGNLFVFPGNRDNIYALVGLAPRKVAQKKTANMTGVRPTASPGGAAAGGSYSEFFRRELIEIIGDILLIRISDEDVETNFSNLGFDSITTKEAAREIGLKFGINVSPAILYSFPTIHRLGEHLLDGNQARLKRYYAEALEKDDTASSLSPQEEPAAHPVAIVSSPEPEEPVPRSCVPATGRDIAIIGISGRFPGSKDVSDFWKHLVNCESLVREVPRERWDWKEYWGDPLSLKNKTNSKWGAFIDDVAGFDPLFFKISPQEAEMMDPQHRLFLECVWEAIEDAGYRASALAGKRISVFAGAQFYDYSNLLFSLGINNSKTGTGNSHAVLANRVSYILDLHGPSESLDTACSSSLVAFHRAVQSIRCGESEMAITGGVSLMLLPEGLISASKMGIISPTGRCRTFDKEADGYVKGEGIHAFLLKPLNAAEEEGDHIYAVVKGTAVNHGGQAHSLTAPNAAAQAEVIRAAWKDSRLDPGTATYLECHGTGTELGDPVEITGLKTAFRNMGIKQETPEGGGASCGLGSVKSNIGHLEPAAGTAGIMKIILAMKYRKLPGQVNFRELNPYIDLSDSPFYIVESTREWEALKTPEGVSIPLRAGVSSFGFGGANAHIVLEEYRSAPRQPEIPQGENIFVLSARSEAALGNYAKRFYEFLQDQGGDFDSVSDICYTLQTGREEMDVRLALVISGFKELMAGLSDFARTGSVKGRKALTGRVKKDHKPVVYEILAQEKELSREHLEAVAAAWVEGGKVGWDALNQGRSSRRVALPTYPFEHRQYWVSSPKREKAGRPGRDGLKPLLSRNVSTLGEQKFLCLLNGDESFLKDYPEPGKNVFPHMLIPEMALEAAQLSLATPVACLSGIQWFEPVVMPGFPAELCIKLYAADNPDFEVTIPREAGTAEVVSSGRIITADLRQELACPLPEEFRKMCHQTTTFKAFFRNKGRLRGYGDSYRFMDIIYHSPGRALAELDLSIPAGAERSDFFLRLPLLECALQLAGVAAGYSETLVPVFAERIILHESLREEALCLVMLRDPGEFYQCDAFFLGKGGRKFLSIQGLYAVKAADWNSGAEGIPSRVNLLKIMHGTRESEISVEKAAEMMEEMYGD